MVSERFVKEVTEVILIWMTMTVIVPGMLYLLGMQMGDFGVVISTILTIGMIGKIFGKRDEREMIWAAVTAGMIIVVVIAFSMTNYDVTFDGNCYHKQAIGLLKDGWNPVLSDAVTFNELSFSIDSYIANNASNAFIWSETYPKASWYFASAIYFVTNRIESGKSCTLLFMVILCGFTYNKMMNRTNNRIRSGILAIITALNPIALAQIQSFYVDGVAGCVLLLLIIEFISLADVEWSDVPVEDKVIILSLIIWGCNLKFSITLFTGIICILYFATSLYYRRTHCAKLFLFLLTSTLFSVVGIGFSPYVTNLLRYSDLLAGYTMLDTSDESINIYFGIDGLNRFSRSLLSLYGRMSHGNYHSVAELLKIPFTFKREELAYYDIPDARVSAFGVLFGGIFTVSLIILILYFWKWKCDWTEKRTLLLLYIVSTIIEVFAFTTSYQMRYIPHLYIVPVAAVFILMTERSMQISRLAAFLHKTLLGVLLLAMAVNVFPWINRVYIKQYKGIETTEFLENISDDGELEIAFWVYDWNGLHYNLRDFGIESYEYVLVDEIDMEKASMTYEGQIFIEQAE